MSATYVRDGKFYVATTNDAYLMDDARYEPIFRLSGGPVVEA